jgi:D-threo-aldose 1-dehydrogenase
MSFEAAMEPGGPVEALQQLRNDGLIGHLGVAGGPIDLLRRYVATGVFEVVLSHNRYTLIDQSAEPLIEDAAAAGIGFINAAPYGGGLLVKGPELQPKYGYRPASDDILSRVHAMERACREVGVPLAAAALKCWRGPRGVASTVVGLSAPERLDQTLELANWPIPEELWAQISTGR